MPNSDNPSQETICPWCQTEIVWDPEIGPEQVCPHCFNELGEYRSVTFTPEMLEDDEDFDDDPDGQDDLDWEEQEVRDVYQQRVNDCIDFQEEAPECSTCREFMLLAGDQVMEEGGFSPKVHKPIGRSVLAAPFKMNVYVCPSCFKVETVLSESDRQSMIEAIKR